MDEDTKEVNDLITMIITASFYDDREQIDKLFYPFENKIGVIVCLCSSVCVQINEMVKNAHYSDDEEERIFAQAVNNIVKPMADVLTCTLTLLIEADLKNESFTEEHLKDVFEQALGVFLLVLKRPFINSGISEEGMLESWKEFLVDQQKDKEQ